MATTTLISPLDQPLNQQRLISPIKDSLLQFEIYSELIVAVAYAKYGVINRLNAELTNWSAAGNKSTAYIGIDQKVTSKEALLLVENIFDSAYIINHKAVTYHPKVYAFKGEKSGRIILGSNNLTSGGLETNFESAAIIDCDFAKEEDKTLFDTYWMSLLELTEDRHGISSLLTNDLIELLSTNDLLHIETRVPGVMAPASSYQTRSTVLDELFASSFSVKLPARQKTRRPSSQNTKKPNVPTAANAVPTIPSATTATTANAKVSSADEFETFIIQIKPHHNGEVFLSKLAVNENPAFFGYPFTGSTIPKKAGKNKSYPQRDPDPTINLIAYGSGGQKLITLSNYRLNTVYYSVKSEIRITCSPIVGVVPEYSIMIMNKPLLPYAVDYEVVIHTPESPEYQSWVGKCTNKMPGGGKAPRAYGWL